MNIPDTLYPIRYCTNPSCKPRVNHASHLYTVDPVDGDLHRVYICPGTTGCMEVFEEEESTLLGFLIE